MNQHMISHWCRIQPSIAWSSGEAELFAGSRGLSNGIGIWNTLKELRGADWGKMRHHVDASACKSILLRKGSGSIKHLETKDLWVQAAIRQKGIQVIKIPREMNFSDSLASYNNAGDLHKQLTRMGYDRVDELAKRPVWETVLSRGAVDVRPVTEPLDFALVGSRSCLSSVSVRGHPRWMLVTPHAVDACHPASGGCLSPRWPRFHRV